jgi:hypothetical protein
MQPAEAYGKGWLGCAVGGNQRDPVSVSRGDFRDQMPTVECDFLLQPIVDGR